MIAAGKTTLLKRILTTKTDLRCAIIVNDMSELNIDASLVKNGHLVQASACCPNLNAIKLESPAIAMESTSRTPGHAPSLPRRKHHYLSLHQRKIEGLTRIMMQAEEKLVEMQNGALLLLSLQEYRTAAHMHASAGCTLTPMPHQDLQRL